MRNYTSADLDAEIRDGFGRLEKRQGEVTKKWLVRLVMSGHSDVTGSDADFALFASESHVTKRVEAHFQKIRADEKDLDKDEQFVIEGFDYIKRWYLVPRHAETVAVHVNAMTSSELRAKAEQLRAYAHGALEHADELDRLAGMREEAAKERA